MYITTKINNLKYEAISVIIVLYPPNKKQHFYVDHCMFHVFYLFLKFKISPDLLQNTTKIHISEKYIYIARTDRKCLL